MDTLAKTRGISARFSRLSKRTSRSAVKAPLPAEWPRDYADDAAMVQGALRGDQPMVDRLVETLECVDRILRARNARLGGLLAPDDLEDLAQDVRAIVWRRLSEYREVAAFTSWVYGICEFSLRNALRSRQRRPFVDVGDVEDLGEGGEAEQSGSPEFHDAIHDCMNRLVAADQRIVRSRHFDGNTLEKTARQSGMNVNTLKSRYLRSLRRLRDCLSQKGVIESVAGGAR